MIIKPDAVKIIISFFFYVPCKHDNIIKNRNKTQNQDTNAMCNANVSS